VTSDSGLLLVRELDELLGLSLLMAELLADDRRGKNSQLPLTYLLMSSSADSASKKPTTSGAGEMGVQRLRFSKSKRKFRV